MFFLFAIHYPLFAIHHLYAAAPNETQFNKDMSYYGRTAKSKNLSANDRLYILERFRQKYKDADFDLSPLFGEIDKWYGIRLKEGKPAHQKESNLPRPQNPEPRPHSSGQLTRVLVTEGNTASRLILDVPGNVEYKDEIIKDGSGLRPPVILIYLYDTQEKLQPLSRNFAVKRGAIRQVQSQTISRKPNAVKVSVSLRDDLPYQVTRAGDQIVLTLEKSGAESMAPTVVTSTESESAPPELARAEVRAGAPEVKISSAISITVIGAVKSPGTLHVKPETKLLEAILLAGGFESNAKTRQVRIVRKDQGKKVTHEIDLTEVLKIDPSKDIPLKPGDLIVVPEKNAFRENILSGKALPWATFLVSIGLVLALLI